MSPAEQRTELSHHFPFLNQGQLDRLVELEALYTEWNSKINVISRKDVTHFFEHHLLHSLALLKVWQPQKGQRVMDIGTGGGFPGIPLAIALPDLEFTLLDSIGKKVKVATEVSQALNLPNVTVLKGRAEECSGRYEVVLSRAVASLEKLTDWCTRFGLSCNALYCLKGGDLCEEIAAIDRRFPSRVYHLNQYFKPSFFETKAVVYVDLSF